MDWSIQPTGGFGTDGYIAASAMERHEVDVPYIEATEKINWEALSSGTQDLCRSVYIPLSGDSAFHKKDA